MKTEFEFSTCNCVFVIDLSDFSYMETIQKCQHHKALDGQALFDEALSHNRSFSTIGVLTEEEVSQEAQARGVEKERIKALGEPIKDV